MRSLVLICVYGYALFQPFVLSKPAKIQGPTSPSIKIDVVHGTSIETWTTHKNDLVVVVVEKRIPRAIVEGESMQVSCRASYPVTLKYEGDGDFNYSSVVYGSSICEDNKTTGPSCIPEFMVSRSLSKLMNHHTGKYVCKGINSNSTIPLTSSFFLYVKDNIYNRQHTIAIPPFLD